MMMNMMNGIPFSFFWIVPLVCMGCFVVVMLLLKGRGSQRERVL